MKVYILMHWAYSDTTRLGVYTTQEKAEAARERALAYRPYGDVGYAPFDVSSLGIDEFEIDADAWEDK